MTDDNDLDTIRTIVSGTRIAVLTTVSPSGELHSRPLAVLEDDFEGSVWFFTQDPSPKTTDVAANAEVNVSYADGKSYLSLAGTATVEHDQARIDQLWNPMVEAWFENGREDPTVALLRVDARSAEFWAIDKPGIVRAFEVAKALVTKTTPDVGENKTVAL
jgi:general stress protein 26